MNLADIQTEIEHELRHAPSTARWTRDVKRVVNRIHEDLCGGRPWPWMMSTVTLRLWPEFTVASWSIVTAGAGTDYDYITFSDSLLPSNLELGQLTGAEVVVNGTAYIVERVASSSPPTVELYLDPSFPNGESVSGSLTFRQRRHQLPPDCASVLEVYQLFEDGTQGECIPAARAWADLAQLNQQVEASRVACYATQEVYERLSPHLERPTTPTFAEQTHNPAPSIAPTVAAQAGAGTSGFTSGSTYYYAFAWVYSGRVSRLGPVSSAVFSGGASDGFVISGAYPNAPGERGRPGRQRALFRAESEEGPFWLVKPNLTAGSYIDGGDDLRFDRSIKGTGLPHDTTFEWQARHDRMERGGHYEYLRFWPQPSEALTVCVRYRRRPAKLLDAYDEPELPRHHSILVYKACMALAGRRAPDLMRRMEKLLEHPMRALDATILPPERMKASLPVMGAGVGRAYFPISPVINWEG